MINYKIIQQYSFISQEKSFAHDQLNGTFSTLDSGWINSEFSFSYTFSPLSASFNPLVNFFTPFFSKFYLPPKVVFVSLLLFIIEPLIFSIVFVSFLPDS